MTGCVKYDAHLIDCNGKVVCRYKDWSGRWGRRLDETSKAFIVVENGKGCCDCVPSPNFHELVITQSGSVSWVGPVTGVETSSDGMLIRASDRSHYWFRRVIPQTPAPPWSHNLTQVDAIFAWQNLIGMLDAECPVRLTPANLPTNTGILVDRSWTPGKGVAEEIRSLSDSAIDWTVVGEHIYMGGTTVPVDPWLSLSVKRTWSDRPPIFYDGAQQVNRVWVNGSGDLKSVYPATVDTGSCPCLLETSLNRTEITSQSELDALAKTYFERHQNSEVSISTGGIDLASGSRLLVKDAIPGRVYRIVVDVDCDDREIDLRLKEIDVTVESKIETSVEVDLQPVGTV